MLSKIRPWHHVVVGIVIAIMALLAGVRVIGAGDDALFRPESFDSKQVTIWPDGDDGVRIREVVDIDFGLERAARLPAHHPQRLRCTRVGHAWSPRPTTRWRSSTSVIETRIRVGDPDITYTGRHRYELEYVLPDAGVSSGVLALDVIGNDETFETDRFEVVLTGFDFGTTACDTGSYGSFGGCELTRDDDGRYVTVIEPFEPHDGITVGGRIDGFVDVDLPPAPAPPIPARTGFARSVSHDPGRYRRSDLCVPPGTAGVGATTWSVRVVPPKRRSVICRRPEPVHRARRSRLHPSGHRQGTGPDGDDRVRPAPRARSVAGPGAAARGRSTTRRCSPGSPTWSPTRRS